MGVVLGLIAISFGIWGIGDIFRGFGQSTVAKVGNTEIRIDQFRQIYQERLQQLSRRVGRPITPDQARALGLDRQFLGQVVAETVLDERTRSLRLGLDEKEIARRVTDDPNFKGLTGQFDRARFEQLIRQNGLTEARFLAEQRRTALRQQLVGTVGASLGAPATLADAFNRYQNEQRTIEYVLLGRDQAGEIAAPAPEGLTKYFEERKVLFRSPEYRKIVLLVLTPADLAPTIEIFDADVKRAYEDRRERYVTPERRQIQQIVFPNRDEARAAADKIAKGMTFSELAAERGLKESDLDLGTIARSAMVDRAVADAAFALKPGEVSAPVEGRFVIALLNVLKVEPGAARLFEEVSADLKRELATERANAEMTSVHDKIEDERLSGVPINTAAEKLKLTPRTIEVDRSGRSVDGTPVGNLPQGVNVLSSSFIAEIGGDNDPLQVPNRGGYVWFDVLDIKPSRDRPLDEVKDQVETRWREEQIAARLRTKTAEILERLKGGAPFAEVAAAEQLKVEWRPGLKRGSPPPGIPTRALDEVFKTPKDGIGSADGATATDRIVYRVTEITVPPLDLQSDEAKRMDETLRRAISDDLLAQYIGRLQTEIGVTINQSALNQITGSSNN